MKRAGNHPIACPFSFRFHNCIISRSAEDIAIGVAFELISQVRIVSAFHHSVDHQDDRASCLWINQEMAAVSAEPAVAPGVRSACPILRIHSGTHPPTAFLPEALGSRAPRLLNLA